MFEDKRAMGLETLSPQHLDGLVRELGRRVMVVNPDALDHLVQRGVLAPLARDGCCKPDGGTCCPNAKLRVNPGDPGSFNPGAGLGR
jgi:hypothetical protein